MIGRRIGRFRILSRLGQGGMATVWKARDEILARDVALKILDERLAHSEQVRARFGHEARTAAALSHPGLLAIYDCGESDGAAYIAMRIVDGETLSDRVSHRLMPVDEAVRIIITVAEALAYAHGRGVIHRDVTGHNIMIDRDGRGFLMDFGLARATWETRLTSTGTTMGTPAYMAPELITGQEADERSDLYGLGVVFYEALTGGLPYPLRPGAGSAFPSLTAEPIAPRARRDEIPETLERIVLQAISRDRGMRYLAVEDLAGELRAFRRLQNR